MYAYPSSGSLDDLWGPGTPRTPADQNGFTDSDDDNRNLTEVDLITVCPSPSESFNLNQYAKLWEGTLESFNTDEQFIHVKSIENIETLPSPDPGCLDLVQEWPGIVDGLTGTTNYQTNLTECSFLTFKNVQPIKKIYIFFTGRYHGVVTKCVNALYTESPRSEIALVNADVTIDPGCIGCLIFDTSTGYTSGGPPDTKMLIFDRVSINIKHIMIENNSTIPSQALYAQRTAVKFWYQYGFLSAAHMENQLGGKFDPVDEKGDNDNYNGSFGGALCSGPSTDGLFEYQPKIKTDPNLWFDQWSTEAEALFYGGWEICYDFYPFWENGTLRHTGKGDASCRGFYRRLLGTIDIIP